MKFHSFTRRQLIQTMAAVAGSVSGLSLPTANAQSFPSKNITILVPFPAGGPTDLMARVLGEILTEKLGQSVIVDNRPGGGGQIAGGALIRSASDGHMLIHQPN